MTSRPTSQEREYTNQWKPDPSVLPKEWDLERLKYVSRVNPSSVDKKSREGETEVELCNYTEVYNNELIDSSFDFLEATATDREIRRFKLSEGDILFTKDSEDWTDIGVPAFVSEDLPGVICGYHLFHTRPEEDMVVPKYLFWALKSRYVAFQFEGAATGVTRYGLTTQDVANAWIPHPPKEVQSRIASFLDQRTNYLDALIERNRELHELLDEKREALVTDTVTSGLDPNVEPKHSGVDCIGYIPPSWRVVKLNWITNKIGSGKTPEGGETSYVDDGVTFLRSQNIHFDGLRLDDVAYITEETHRDMSSTEVKSGDVLLNITGASLGRCCIVPENFPVGNVNQHVCIIRPKRDVVAPKFLNYVISSRCVQHQIFADQGGASREAVTFSKIGDFQVPVPPRNAQQLIVEYLDEKTDLINQLQNNLTKSLDVLCEKRRALITAAVTGQIDVMETQSSELETTI